MDSISFGPSRKPRRVRRGWRPWRGWPGTRAWLAVLAAAAAAVGAVVVVTSGGHAPREVSAPVPSTGLPPLLGGVPARGARTDFFLGGENLWRVSSQPRAVATGLLFNGLSPLLPSGHGAEVDQLAPVPGGVVAHIGDVSTGITYGALGRVVFIPATNAPARVIARATMIAVSPSGREVWVQTAIQSSRNGERVPASFRSPTWAVNLAGQRVTPVLELPLGLVAAAASGPLTQNLATGQLQWWDGATGRPIPLKLPPNADFVAAGQDRVIWDECNTSCRLHATDLDTGTDAAMQLPGNWFPESETYPPPLVGFDPSGRRLVLPLDRTNSTGTATAEDLFVADLAAKTLRVIPGGPLPLPSPHRPQPMQLTGVWDQQGLLWVLAMKPSSGYYQLGFWTGTGPLHTFATARGSPATLSAPGPG